MMLIYDIVDMIILYWILTEENNRINKKQQEVDAKKKEIETSLENASNKTIRESKKEANIIGDSDSE
jgi:hypothetical protein